MTQIDKEILRYLGQATELLSNATARFYAGDDPKFIRAMIENAIRRAQDVQTALVDLQDEPQAKKISAAELARRISGRDEELIATYDGRYRPITEFL